MPPSSSAALKRLMRENKQFQENPAKEFVAYPLESNIMEWHFTMAGPVDSPYEKGLYHGKVLIPQEYPFAPPDVQLLTPNGRFELNKRICLSISSYHPENWHSTWGIATVLHALREFMLTPGNNAIGAIEYPKEIRANMATESLSFHCDSCGESVAEHALVMEVAGKTQTGDSKENEMETNVQRKKDEENTVPETVERTVTRPPDIETEEVVPPPPADAAAPAVAPAVAPAAVPAAVPAPLPAPAPAPVPAALERNELRPNLPAPIVRRGGGFEVNISLKRVDSLLWILYAITAFIIVKKLVVDWGVIG